MGSKPETTILTTSASSTTVWLLDMILNYQITKVMIIYWLSRVCPKKINSLIDFLVLIKRIPFWTIDRPSSCVSEGNRRLLDQSAKDVECLLSNSTAALFCFAFRPFSRLEQNWLSLEGIFYSCQRCLHHHRRRRHRHPRLRKSLRCNFVRLENVLIS